LENYVTGDDFIASLLLPDERVKWSVSNLAARPKRGLIVIGMFALAFLVSVITVFVMDADSRAAPDTFASAGLRFASIMLPMLMIYLWIAAAGRVYALFEPLAPRRREEMYVLTDRRLIAASSAPATIQIITSVNYLYEARLIRNGRACELALWFGPRGPSWYDEYYDWELPLMLCALENGAEVKKEIIKYFGPPKC
jgi:hypothetical protein